MAGEGGLGLVFLLLLVGASEAAAQPPAADQPPQTRRLTKREARRAAEEQARADYTADQIREAGKQIALQRVQAWSWLVNPSAQVNWLGARAYFAHGWETRPAEGRPATAITFGAEVFFNSWAGLDLLGRVGGASFYTPLPMPDRTRATVALDVTAGLRWTIAGLVPVSLGWGMTRHVLEQPGAGADQTVATAAEAHHAWLAAGFTIRGASLETGCRIGVLPSFAATAEALIERNFSAICGVGLLTPALVGF